MNKSVLSLILCSLLWSCGGIFIKLINIDSPMAISGWRSLISFVFLCIYTRSLPKFVAKKEDDDTPEKEKPYGKGTVNLLLGGLFYALTLVTFVIATRLTTAANAILLQYTNSIYIIILAPFMLKEKNSLIDYVAVAGLILGMVLLVGGGLNADSMTGILFAVLSGCVYGLTTVFLRRQKNADPLESLKLSNFFCFLMCSYSMVKAGCPDGKSLVFLLILGVFQIGVASILFARGVKGVPALNSAVITMIEPLMNPVWVALFYGEIPSAFSITGGVVILSFIILHVAVKARKIQNPVE